MLISSPTVRVAFLGSFSHWVFLTANTWSANRVYIRYMPFLFLFQTKTFEEKISIEFAGWLTNLTFVTNFHPLEVVIRGSETQLQVGENFN